MGKKKLMSLFALGCSALLLVGCGEDTKKEENKEKDSSVKTITCVQVTDEISSEMSFKFKKEKLVSGEMSVDVKMDMSEFTDEQVDQIDQLLESQYQSQCDEGIPGFKNCSFDGENGNYTLSYELDMEQLDKLFDGKVSENISIDDLKEKLEEDDEVTCTIK